jgi:hypothetical protein
MRRSHGLHKVGAKETAIAIVNNIQGLVGETHCVSMVQQTSLTQRSQIMLKPLALAVLLAIGQPALATTWSYDFSGTLGDHFDQLMDTPDPSTAFQADGMLSFHTNGSALPAVDELFVYRDLQPTYQQSWSAQMQVTVPASLDNQTRTGEEGFYVAASLIAFTRDGNANLDKVISIDLESSPPNNHVYWTGWSTIGVEDDDVMAYQPTSDVTGVIELRFDAASKVLSAHNAYGQLLNVDIDDPSSNWGLSGNAPIYLAIGFDSEGMSVEEYEALSIDNFSVTLHPVPEPEIYALMLAGLGFVGFAARQRKACLSCCSVQSMKE